jgi:hypothetical protein
MIEPVERGPAVPTPCSSLKTNGDACRIHARWTCLSCGMAYCGIHIRRDRTKYETVARCTRCGTEATEIRLHTTTEDTTTKAPRKRA